MSADRRLLRVAVYGEGPGDYGEWDPVVDQLGQEGCYLAFVRTAASRCDFECIKAGRFPLPLPGRKKRRVPKLKGFEPHSFYATLEAALDDGDVLVIGTDTDHGVGGKKRRLPDACRRKYEELRSGYEKAPEFMPAASSVSLVRLVPLVKLESWLLADEGGFRSAAGFARGRLPKKPEELYGQTDAKDQLNRLFRDNGRSAPNTRVKAQLACAARPPVLRQQCPNSHPQFADDVAGMGSSC